MIAEKEKEKDAVILLYQSISILSCRFTVFLPMHIDYFMNYFSQVDSGTQIVFLENMIYIAGKYVYSFQKSHLLKLLQFINSESLIKARARAAQLACILFSDKKISKAIFAIDNSNYDDPVMSEMYDYVFHKLEPTLQNNILWSKNFIILLEKFVDINVSNIEKGPQILDLGIE